MKKLLIIIYLSIGILYSQSASLYFISDSAICDSNVLYVKFHIDIAGNGGGVWLERSPDTTGFVFVNNTQHFTNDTGIVILHYIFDGSLLPYPLLDGYYRLRYVDLSWQYQSIDTFQVTCGHFLGIEEYKSNVAISEEYYTIHGQKIENPDEHGLYIKISTYFDKSRKITKEWH